MVNITNQNMVKLLFLIRERAIPNAGVTSVSRAEIASTSRNNPLSEQLPFLILDETSKMFSNFNATGRSLLMKFSTPGEEENPTAYLRECINCTNELPSERRA